MRAVVVREFGPIERHGIEELADSTPGPDEIVLDVKAAEVNYPDLLVMTGQYQVKPPLPFSPGKTAVGTVSALGRNVSGLAIGDRVAAQVEYGAFAQQLRAPAKNVFRLPLEIDYVKGAALGLVYQTAHFALIDRARMQPGETVLVLGASGGIGTASVQLAKALGAKHVIGGVLGHENAEVARRAGADTVIELSGDDLRDRLREQVHRVTGGHGADIVIDPVGGAAHSAALRAMAWRGRMVIIGFASGDIPAIKANYLLLKNIEVSGLQWSDYRDRAPEWIARVQQEIFDLYLAGKIDPYVSQTYPLDAFQQALACLQRGTAQGKIVLEIN